LLDRAAAAGVTRIVAVGDDLTSSAWNVEAGRRNRAIVPAVGLHPLRVTHVLGEEELAKFASLASDRLVRFVGEIGVDSIDSRVDLAIQLAVLRQLLDLATRARKPVNLHLRGEVDSALGVIGESGIVEVGAIIHYFVGNSDEAERLLDAGLILSVGKPVTRAENGAVREAVQVIPTDRLLLETDSYPLPGRATEPADLPIIAAAVASIRGGSLDDVARETGALFTRLSR
jgi:TatD DNase family protein